MLAIFLKFDMLVKYSPDSLGSFFKSHAMKNSNTSSTARSVNVRLFANGVAVATIKMLPQTAAVTVTAELPVRSV